MSSTQTHTLSSYRYNSDTKSFVPRTTEKSLGENDVLIRTTHSGLCATDVHAKLSGSGCSLGHEGIGFVQEAGSKVKTLKKGQRVGWGWLNSVRSFPYSDGSRLAADKKLPSVLRLLPNMQRRLPTILLPSPRLRLLRHRPRLSRRLPNHQLRVRVCNSGFHRQ